MSYDYAFRLAGLGELTSSVCSETPTPPWWNCIGNFCKDESKIEYVATQYALQWYVPLPQRVRDQILCLDHWNADTLKLDVQSFPPRAGDRVSSEGALAFAAVHGACPAPRTGDVLHVEGGRFGYGGWAPSRILQCAAGAPPPGDDDGEQLDLDAIEEQVGEYAAPLAIGGGMLLLLLLLRR